MMSAAASCAFILAVNIGAPMFAATDAKVDAMKLSQIHNFMGKFDVYVSKNGIRVENTSQLKFILVATAPDWNVTIYRMDDKTYWRESLAELEDTGLFSGFLFTKKERYVNPRYFRHSKMNLNGFIIDRMTSQASTIKTMRMPANMPKQIERILYAVYKLPTNGGIPVGFAAVHVTSDFLQGTPNKGRMEYYLDTSKMANVSVSSSMFRPPAGLTRAPSLRDVASGKSAKAHTEDVRVLWDK